MGDFPIVINLNILFYCSTPDKQRPNMSKPMLGKKVNVEVSNV